MTQIRPRPWRALQRFLTLTALLLTAAVPLTGHGSDNDSEVVPLNIVADSVRERGYSCDDPKEAKRDEAASKPDEAAWLIDCGNGRYRVIYKGDTGAEVEEID